MRPAFGDHLPSESKPGPGSFVCPVPSGFMTQRSLMPAERFPSVEARVNRILPVDDHDGKSSHALGVFVTLWRPVPSALTTQMSRLRPVRVLANASCRPSGDHTGWKSPNAGKRSTG